MDDTPVYLIVKKTGLKDNDDREVVIVYGMRRSRGAADDFATKNPGTEVVKDWLTK